MRTKTLPLLLVTALVCWAGPAGADQGSAAVRRIDFAVPDAPAFTVVEVDPSTILRPATVRDLTVSASQFVGSGTSIAIPASLAIEFSPGLVIAGEKLEIDDYRMHPALYRLRVSAATRRLSGETSASEVGLGIRVTAIDRADLRTHLDYLTSVECYTGEIGKHRQLIQDGLMALPDTLKPKALEVPDAAVLADTLSMQAPGEWERTLNKSGFASEHVREVITRLGLVQTNLSVPEQQRAIRSLTEAFQDSLWNATVLDFALAGRARAADSTGRGVVLDRVAGWATFGAGLGTWGQLLLGTRMGADRDPAENRFSFAQATSARLYVGHNTMKAFAEGQWTFANQKGPTYFLNSGTEFRARQGWWFTGGVGVKYDQDTQRWNLETGCSLKLGLPNVLPG